MILRVAYRGYETLRINGDMRSVAKSYAYIRFFIRKLGALQKKALRGDLPASVDADKFLKEVQGHLDSLRAKSSEAIGALEETQEKLEEFLRRT